MIINFFNTFVNITDEDAYIKEIADNLERKDKKTFFYLNSYSFYLANKNRVFELALNKADYIIADGISIVWGIKWLNKINIAKIGVTHNFNSKLGSFLESKKCRIFCLGGSQNIITNAVEKMRINFPSIQICSFHHGYFDIKIESEKIIDLINTSSVDIVLVGMGMPRSEIWIQENISRINTNLIFSVGGFFDFLAGRKKLAPKWIRNSGLEWFYRFIQEPKRLFARYFKANLFFLKKIIQYKFDV